jgi:hypothetical protein
MASTNKLAQTLASYSNPKPYFSPTLHFHASTSHQGLGRGLTGLSPWGPNTRTSCYIKQMLNPPRERKIIPSIASITSTIGSSITLLSNISKLPGSTSSQWQMSGLFRSLATTMAHNAGRASLHRMSHTLPTLMLLWRPKQREPRSPRLL